MRRPQLNPRRSDPELHTTVWTRFEARHAVGAVGVVNKLCRVRVEGAAVGLDPLGLCRVATSLVAVVGSAFTRAHPLPCPDFGH